MNYVQRLGAWFSSSSTWLLSMPLGAAATLTSYAYHAGPFRWLQEAQVAVFGGTYSVQLSFVVILFATHTLVSGFGAALREPLKNRATPRLVQTTLDWYLRGSYSFYAFLLGGMLMGMAAWTGMHAMLAGELVLSKPARLMDRNLAATWVYLDGEPLADRMVTKGSAIFVPYIDPGKNAEDGGVIVMTGGSLGLKQMKIAHQRNLGLEVTEKWDGLEPDVRAHFVEHGLPWVATARVYRYGQSPKQEKDNALWMLGLGAVLMGLGYFCRPRPLINS